MNYLIEVVQQYGPLFGILAAIATVLGLAFTIYKSAHDRQVREFHELIAQKDTEIASLKREGYDKFEIVNSELKKQLELARHAIHELQTNFAATEDTWKSEKGSLEREREYQRNTVQALSRELEAGKEVLAEREQEDRARIRLMKRAMRLEGKVWERKVLQSAPQFCPLSERHTPIISVLNLKGGVGKTTVTAHLGSALAEKGYNVLLMDLDLQGSLSSLFMSESALVQRSKEKTLLQHYLLSVAERQKANLLEHAAPIFNGKSAIVPNADSMAYAELNLTLHWLLRLGKRDTRFLLRKALQQKRVTRRFNFVLLDCPPLFNTCCVNALAASDYVLIPVVPSRKAAERVPLLLERLQSLHQVINPQLQLIGVLLNRTHGSSLTAWEQDLWRDMLDHGKTCWTLPIPAFQTYIRQTTEVRDGETEFAPPAPGSELHALFSQLVAEVESRLPGDCCRITAAPVRPE